MTTVSADREPVIVVWGIVAAEHHRVGVPGRTDPMQPHPPLQTHVAGGQFLIRNTADIVERIPSRQPRKRGVTGAWQRPVYRFAGTHVQHHDVAPGLLADLLLSP